MTVGITINVCTLNTPLLFIYVIAFYTPNTCCISLIPVIELSIDYTGFLCLQEAIRTILYFILLNRSTIRTVRAYPVCALTCALVARQARLCLVVDIISVDAIKTVKFKRRIRGFNGWIIKQYIPIIIRHPLA